MKIVVFSTKAYDRAFLEAANLVHKHEIVFQEPRLTRATLALAAGFPAVCVFVNDVLDSENLKLLAASGTRMVALRCAGFNNVDLAAAAENKITVARVPAYSPHAVAEFTVGLMLALNRKLHKAWLRVRDANFSLDGLIGFDFHGKTVGIVGTGRIGALVAKIMHGFGCKLLAHDLNPNSECTALGVTYLPLDDLLAQSDLVSLHCPLIPGTHHLINEITIGRMKPGAMLINTSRGGLIDTAAVIQGLKSGQIGALGLDVYEEEADLFFEDLSGQVIQDDTFARLQTFPNVLITGHQAFFTRNAMEAIAQTTLTNITRFEAGISSGNEVKSDRVRKTIRLMKPVV
ncbi:MAG TPA: 2-hydroxyacid dehydrogenase [Planctomycetota bacterium]|nr:2-hydroxyacid dehydrogenase [Planctomycetota bacterium]